MLLLISLLVPLISKAQISLVKTKVNDDISLKIPDTFTSLTTGERVNKFVSSKTPLAIYSSIDREVDLGINTNIMQWISGDEETLRGFYKASFETLFDEVTYLQDTIKVINGKKFIVFEFVSSLKDENAFSGAKFSKNYTYIQYTSYKGQILLFNLGCKGRLMDQWRPVAREIMESVQVKK
ncbi:MAG: hypothetical protein Tsb0034_23400 [Ekhidna sp.]